MGIRRDRIGIFCVFGLVVLFFCCGVVVVIIFYFVIRLYSIVGGCRGLFMGSNFLIVLKLEGVVLGK